MLTRIIPAILLVMLLASCREATSRRTIVVLTQFAANTLPYQQLEKALHQEFDSLQYEVILQTGSEPTAEYVYKGEYFHDAGKTMNECLNHQKARPDLIILQGEMMAYSGALSQHEWLESIPVLCINVTHPEWKGILRSRKNFVVMESRPAIRENINFIRNLGQPSWIVTCLDHTYLDDYLRLSIDQQIGADTTRYCVNPCPSVQEILSPEWRDTTRSTLIPTSLLKTEETSVDSLSWFDDRAIMQVIENRMTFLRIKDDCYGNLALEYNIGYFFTLTPDVFNLPVARALNGCLGGYFTPWSVMLEEAHPVADQLLDGVAPHSIPWQRHHCDYWLDWRYASHIHPYAEDFPRYVRFVNLPWERTSRLHMFCYNLSIPLLVTLLLVIMIILPLTIAVKNYILRSRIIKQGEEAREIDRQIEDALMAINAYHFMITPEKQIVLSESVGKVFNIRVRPIPLDVMLRLLKPSYREQIREFVDNPEQKSLHTEVIAHNFKTGQDHALLVQLTRLIDERADGICSGIVIFNDEAHRAEKEKMEAFQRSEEATAKESFLAAMGHEIRTPLNAIVGFSQVLIEHNNDLSDEERTAYGDYILESNDELLHLLENVMNYSRKNGDQIHLELNIHEVAKLMEEIYITHSVIVPKHLTFDYLRGPAGLEVKVNRTSLHQVISNLMNNAIKFTEKGGITIGWECEDAEFCPMAEITEENPPKYVVIYVQDTGMGIAPEQQKLIFDRYFKQNNQTVGAGIGLSLCREIIGQMDGNISVKSELGHGSRFEVRLPIIQAAPPTPEGE